MPLHPQIAEVLRSLPAPPDGPPDPAFLRDVETRGLPEGSRPALVQVADTPERRQALANEIIKGVILPQFVILPIAVLLVLVARMLFAPKRPMPTQFSPEGA